RTEVPLVNSDTGLADGTVSVMAVPKDPETELPVNPALPERATAAAPGPAGVESFEVPGDTPSPAPAKPRFLALANTWPDDFITDTQEKVRHVVISPDGNRIAAALEHDGERH